MRRYVPPKVQFWAALLLDPCSSSASDALPLPGGSSGTHVGEEEYHGSSANAELPWAQDAVVQYLQRCQATGRTEAGQATWRCTGVWTLLG
jgi:hypothetical protein